MNDRLPLLLDTDIGDNIDDALALAYLLKQPRCELLGVTVVGERAALRAQLAAAVCRAMGRGDVVISGAELHPSAPSEEWAAREAEAIRRRPVEITLLSIGPLTNVAALYQRSPETPSLLREQVMMGGLYGGPVAGYGPAERNIGSDVAAAEVVLRSGVPLRCVGLEVTTQCTLPTQECRARLRSVPLLVELCERWARQGREEIRFHDPLAAACVFEPHLCEFKRGTIHLESDGVTRFEPDPAGPHQVACSVDAQRFFQHFFQILGCW